MGYETVRADPKSIAAAARLVRHPSGGRRYTPQATSSLTDTLPLLIDQVAGEAGIWEPAVCARALEQARGDVARAVSLVRAWAAMLPRRDRVTVAVADLRTLRRITPAFREPDGGQYLGASLDYAQRLLDFEDDGGGDRPPAEMGDRRVNGTHAGVDDTRNGSASPAALPALPRALDALQREGLLDADPPARPVDRTRTPVEAGGERGAFAQLLARAETGAMTGLAYTSIRGSNAAATLAELRTGELDVVIEHPSTGGRVCVGCVPVTVAEVVAYAGRQKADGRLGVGLGATLGRLERRAISAAVLDANCAATTRDPAVAPAPAEDQEFLEIALDGQEATGFLEHLKLPHHVTFTSVLDRIAAGDDDPGDEDQP